jgi:hypothetical protein
MNHIKKILFGLSLTSIFISNQVTAGNKDRTGQAGAYELLINPYARSSGWSGINTACIRGIESARVNVAGLAFTEKTELIFAHNTYLALKGGDMSINNLGFSQRLGKDGGVFGLSIMSMSFGEIPITTTEVPDVVNGVATLGTYKPQFLNLTMSYAKKFSESISGGLGLTVISEAIPNAKAQGVALDAGIQYITGPKDNIHFGISLRNVGTPMMFSGDGLSFSNLAPSGKYLLTQQMRSERFELPSLLNIGGAYDFFLNPKDPDLHRVTGVFNFTSNSFTTDQLGIGVEYAYKKMFMARMGYRYESGIFSADTRRNVYTGLRAGLTFEVPVKKDGPSFAVDYSYGTTNPFHGTHAVGIRLGL